MKRSRVAKRYARALIELASDHRQIEAWAAELERLAMMVRAPELFERLASPDLSQEARNEGIGKIAELLGLSFPLRSLALTVARHGRIAELDAISKAYVVLVDEALRRARAKLTFARRPADSELQGIVQALAEIAGKQIIPTVEVDGALLGGVVAELEGRTYDGSLSSRLANAQQRLSG